MILKKKKKKKHTNQWNQLKRNWIKYIILDTTSFIYIKQQPLWILILIKFTHWVAHVLTLVSNSQTPGKWWTRLTYNHSVCRLLFIFFFFNVSTSMCTFWSKWIDRWWDSIKVSISFLKLAQAYCNIFGAHYFFGNQPLSCIYV